MTQYTSLQNKVALISGGGSGIGRGIALALAAEGAHLAICGRRNDPIQTAIEQVRQTGAKGFALQADVSQPADVERFVQAALEKFGKVDILINNAAISEGAPAHEIAIDDWDRILRVNLRGPFLMTRAVLPYMRKQRSGHILNISSESGLLYYEGDSAYGLSKHALNDFGEYIQRENQDYNIRLNTICPGMVITEMTEGSAGLDPEKCLYPEDIADLALWLLTRRQNIKIGTPILIQTMLNPWE